MQSIVCQVESQPDRVSFTWSQGKDSFEPYHLCGDVARDFVDLAKELRAKLADVVASYLEVARKPVQPSVVDDHRRACLALAQAGHELFRAAFDPGGAVKSQGATARDVRKWLKELQHLNDLTRLEIVHKGTQPLAVPWNLVYDSPPDRAAFLAAGEFAAHWQPFWGVHYDLSGGPSVDPRKRMPWWGARPRVWMVVDRDTGKGLPEEQRRALDEFRQRHAPVWIESAADLEKELAGGRPDLMYWLCHADPSALYLDGEPISPKRLRRLLRADDEEANEERNAGLVFLNACQTAETGEAGSFLETFYHLGMCGLIATEHQTIDTFASPFGLDFLDAFLTRGEAVGAVLQRLRGRVPLGLLYAAYCPPDIRILPANGDKVANVAVQEEAPRSGTTLGSSPAVAAEQLPLPEKPYRSLLYYDRADRALFAGRDGDVLRFARLLDDAGTRLLVLHGESGVGKSSFLRAGVIPYLEDECVGYRFLRDRSQGGGDAVLFVRATNDLTGQLADALHRYCARSYSSRAPNRKTTKVDLPGLLRSSVGREGSVSQLRNALRDDPKLLARLLAALAEALPFSIVLVIDQGEEVFTLARNAADAANRNAALQMLRATVTAAGDFKVIVALRTEYYGQLVDRLRRGLDGAEGVREYLLTDFDEATLAEIVSRPSSQKRIPYAAEVPFQKYGFRYAAGVPEAVARDVVHYTRNRQDSALPLLQVICTQLHERTLHRPDRFIGMADLEAIGGLKGGMRKHVGDLVLRLFPSLKDQRAFKKLMTELYLRQPDGTLTTALTSAEQLSRNWAGQLAFGEMLQTAASGEWRLLRVSTLRLGGEEEGSYVSLGHDALAQVAAEWDDEMKRGTRLRKLLVGVIAIAAVAFLMTGLAALAWYGRARAREQTRIAEDVRKEANNQAEIAKTAAARAWHNLYNGQAQRIQDAESRRRFDLMRELLAEVRPLPGKPYQLTFEWYRSWRLCHADLFAIPSNSAAVYSPDGKILAYACANTVRLWDVDLRQERAPLTGHTEPITSVVFSPDRKTLASASFGTVWLWDVGSGKKLRRLNLRTGGKVPLVFSPDGTTLASADDRTVRLWDVGTGKEVGPLEGQLKEFTGWVTWVTFFPDGKTLATARNDGTVRLWNVDSGKELLPLKNSSSWVAWGAFSPDSKTLALGYNDGTVKLCDVRSGEEPLPLKGHTGGVTWGAFSPDGQTLAFAHKDGTVRLWEVGSGKESFPLKGHTDRVTAVAFSPDGQTLASSGQDQTVRLWDVGSAKKSPILETHTGQVTAVAFSPDGQTLASIGLHNEVQLWDVGSGKQHLLKGHSAWVTAVAFSPDGKTFASAGHDRTVRLWSVGSGKKYLPLKNQQMNTCSVTGVAFSADNKTVAVACDDGAVRLWDIGSGKEFSTIKGHKGWVTSVAFSPLSKTLAFAHYDGPLRLWDVGRDKELPIEGHARGVTSVAFAPDGKTLASSGIDETVRLCDVGSGKEFSTIKGHEGRVTSVAFSSDGKTLASGGIDGTVRLWDMESSKERAFLRDHNTRPPPTINSVAFSPDGKALASADFAGTVRLWIAATDTEVLAYSERHANAFPDHLDYQIDVVLSCWSLYLKHNRERPSAIVEARDALEKGRTKLLQLRQQNRLSSEQLSWLPAFETALRELPVNRP